VAFDDVQTPVAVEVRRDAEGAPVERLCECGRARQREEKDQQQLVTHGETVYLV
jgi:hypothetical protein